MPFKIKYKFFECYNYREIIKYILKPLLSKSKYKTFYKKIQLFSNKLFKTHNFMDQYNYETFEIEYNKIFKRYTKIINNIRLELFQKMAYSVYENNTEYISRNGVFLGNDFHSMLGYILPELDISEKYYYYSLFELFELFYHHYRVLNIDMGLVECFINKFFISNNSFYYNNNRICPCYMLYDIDNSILYCNKEHIISEMNNYNNNYDNFENFKVEFYYYCGFYPYELFKINNKKVIFK